jgi:hypothetical protein
MQSDATLADVLPTAIDPKSYIQGIFAKMWECGAVHGNAYVRMMGRSYRVTYDNAGSEQVFGDYSPTHRSIGDLFESPRFWGANRMGLQDVVAVIERLFSRDASRDELHQILGITTDDFQFRQ